MKETTIQPTFFMDWEESQARAEEKCKAKKKRKSDSKEILLNPKQREIIEHEGSLFVTGGPGTGKTHCLAPRIEKLLTRVAPENIIVLSSTNKACRELQKQLMNTLEKEVSAALVITTFHRLGHQILQQNGFRLGVKEDFILYSHEEALSLMSFTHSELDLPQEDMSACFKAISRKKTILEEVDEEEVGLWNFSQAYSQFLRDNNGVDIDDLILLAVRLLQEFPDLKEKYREQIHSFSIDNFQNLSPAEYELFCLLVSEKTELFLLGDSDQMTHTFQEFDSFSYFRKDFPQVQEMNLKENYRSGKNILKASAQVIAHNNSSTVWQESSKKDGFIYTSAVLNELAQADCIAYHIEKHMRKTSFFLAEDRAFEQEEYSFSSFAVVYRSNAERKILEEVFFRSGVPHQVLGENALSKRMQKILSLLRVIENPRQTSDWIYILSSLPQVGKKICQSILEEISQRYDLRVNELLTDRYFLSSLPLKNRLALENFYEFYLSLSRKKGSLGKILALIWEEPGYGKIFHLSKKEQNVLHYLSYKFPEISLFLTELILSQEEDIGEEKRDCVSFMTLHASQGREFPVVFICGWEEGIIPQVNSNREKERRLFYLGLTRAQEILYLLRAKKRFIYGEEQENQESSFAQEIERELLSSFSWEERKKEKSPDSSLQLDFFNED